jgi:hypothetical protein
MDLITWLARPLFDPQTPEGRLWVAAVITAWLYCGYLSLSKLLSPNGKLVRIVTDIKTYGGNARQAQRLPSAYPFRLMGLRYDDEETHDFIAVWKPDTLMAVRFMTLGDDQAGELARLCVKLLAKTLDNKDGVPVQWEPTVLPKPKNAGANYEPKFRGPDGKLHPMDQAVKFTDPAAGSSRRRWEALVADTDFTIDVEDLVEIVKDLVELTAGTPTAG